MLCTICKKPMHPTRDTAVVWRTLDSLKSGKPKQWAKLPIHNNCAKLIEREIMSSKIRIAAGQDGFEYSVDKPTTENLSIGLRAKEVSDGVWEYEDVKI